jgi:hypothetical protein
VGSWGYGDEGQDEKEDGGRGAPGALHQVAGEELWWEKMAPTTTMLRI